MDPYLTARWLHILSSTVLFGTGIGTAFQMVWAMRTRKLETIHSVASGVVIADWIFTTPAGVIQPLTGLWLIDLAGYKLTEPWLLASYPLYTFAFLCWVPVVILQLKIRDLAGVALATNTPLAARAISYFRIWSALGIPAFAALVAVFWLMVNRPDF